jgi:hypothetical protein
MKSDYAHDCPGCYKCNPEDDPEFKPPRCGACGDRSGAYHPSIGDGLILCDGCYRSEQDAIAERGAFVGEALKW